MWMVRAGEDAYLVDDFLTKNVVAIGWNQVGDLTQLKDLESLKAKLQAAYPDYKTGQINNFAGQIYRFRFDFVPGQKEVTYNPTTRTYHLGEITSAYEYSQTKTKFYHTRQVTWQTGIQCDIFSTAAKNRLGVIMTLFKLPDFLANELLNPGITSAPTAQPLNPEPATAESLAETLEEIKEDIEAKAYGFIEDKVLALNWEQMQELVAGILRGIGYKTLISPKGADRGKDIIASPDGLGLQDPKIVVEVKHRLTSQMGSPEVRSFLGGLRSGDRGMYVSTGGFSKEARYEAERANIPLTLIDLAMLVQLIIQHYDNFDSDTRALIPLKKIYWPV